MQRNTDITIPVETIHKSILFIRGHNVILDKDLADLYGVETKLLNRAVSRNIDRFPEDFMFKLNREEFEDLRCHFGTSNWGGRRYMPHAFTEQCVAMLSSVLRSKRAVEVNIAIMRTFVKLREVFAGNAALRHKIEAMERQYDEQFRLVFEILSEMISQTPESKSQIGYLTEIQEHAEA